MHCDMQGDIYVKKPIPEKQGKHFRCTGAKREFLTCGAPDLAGPIVRGLRFIRAFLMPYSEVSWPGALGAPGTPGALVPAAPP